MLHQHDAARHAGHQVHGTAHALDHLAGDHPVGQVTLAADLHGAQDGQVDLAATDHGETLVAAEDGRALDGGDGLLAGIDQVGVHLVLVGEGADAQHAVLALQPHLDVVGHEVGHQRRDADAEIHIEAVLQLLRRARGHLVLGPGHVLLLKLYGRGWCASRCASRAWGCARCDARRYPAGGCRRAPARRWRRCAPPPRCRSCRPWRRPG